MKALLDHLKNPRPMRDLVRRHGQVVLRDIAEATVDGSDFFALTDIYAYTFDEVKFAKAHLAVLGHA